MIKTKLNRKKETGGIEASLRDRMPYYIMLAPFMIFFVALIALPMIASVALSFFEFDMVSMPVPTGFSNYFRMLFDDSVFIKTLKNTLILAVITLYRLGFLAFGCGEDAHDGLDLRRGGHLVERHAHAPFGGIVEVDALFERQRLHDGCLGLDFERVEELLRCEAVVHRLQRAGDGCGGQVGGFRRAAQPFGTVVDAVEARHRGHQGRGGADVRGGALALDVLFAHLQGHAQRLVAQPVDPLWA